MSSPSSLREYQLSLKSQKRSVRRYIPLIGSKAGMTNGMVMHYLDGYGSSIDKSIALLDAIVVVLKQQETLRELANQPKPKQVRRKYAKHQTF